MIDDGQFKRRGALWLFAYLRLRNTLTYLLTNDLVLTVWSSQRTRGAPLEGATENAGVENAIRAKLQGWKMQEWKKRE